MCRIAPILACLLLAGCASSPYSVALQERLAVSILNVPLVGGKLTIFNHSALPCSVIRDGEEVIDADGSSVIAPGHRAVSYGRLRTNLLAECKDGDQIVSARAHWNVEQNNMVTIGGNSSSRAFVAFGY